MLTANCSRHTIASTRPVNAGGTNELTVIAAGSVTNLPTAQKITDSRKVKAQPVDRQYSNNSGHR